VRGFVFSIVNYNFTINDEITEMIAKLPTLSSVRVAFGQIHMATHP
jgi:hypothetical protein